MKSGGGPMFRILFNVIKAALWICWQFILFIGVVGLFIAWFAKSDD